VLKKRLEWFGGQLDLDPDKLVHRFHETYHFGGILLGNDVV
jgi:hypothetical protein